MLTEVDAHVDGLMTRNGSNESFIQAIRVVLNSLLSIPSLPGFFVLESGRDYNINIESF